MSSFKPRVHEENANLGEPATTDNNVQIGMMVLPDNLDVDPGLSALMPFHAPAKRRSAEGVRLWARHFAPCGNDECIQMPLS
jgi:hypothetical protein